MNVDYNRWIKFNAIFFIVSCRMQILKITTKNWQTQLNRNGEGHIFLKIKKKSWWSRKCAPLHSSYKLKGLNWYLSKMLYNIYTYYHHLWVASCTYDTFTIRLEMIHTAGLIYRYSFILAISSKKPLKSIYIWVFTW